MVLSALFYVTCLILTAVLHKTIFVVYDIKSYQLIEVFRTTANVIVLEVGRRLQCVDIPSLDKRILRTLLPLPVISAGLMITGMIQIITLTRPMAAVSRRLVTFMTLILEETMLGIHASGTVQYSIIVMLVGAIISAANDASLSWYGSYIIVLINDMLSGLNGVYLKKILDTGDLNIWGLMYYDSFFMIVPGSIIAWVTNDFEEPIDSNWNEQLFWCHLLLSFVFNIALMYSTLLCTQKYSALTVTAISNVWSIFVTYFMLFIVGDAIVNLYTFVGLNISLFGAILFIYASITFYRKAGKASRYATQITQDSNARAPALSEHSSYLV